VYGRVPQGWRAEAEATKRMLDALKKRSVVRMAGALTNHLERWVEPVLPVIGRMKAALLAAGHWERNVGSGPTVFARPIGGPGEAIQRRVTRGVGRPGR